MDALVYDAVERTWSGKLPERCVVRVQWWDSEQQRWLPRRVRGLRYPRDEGIEKLKRGVARGPLRYDKYRLVPTKAATSKPPEPAPAPARPPRAAAPPATITEKKRPATAGPRGETMKANPFREGTKTARMFDVLKDGEPKTLEEIAAVVKPGKVAYIGIGYLHSLRKAGQNSDPPFTVERDNGRLVLEYQTTAAAPADDAETPAPRTERPADTPPPEPDTDKPKKSGKKGKKKKGKKGKKSDKKGDSTQP